MDPDETLAQAQDLQRSGELNRAAALYRQILDVSPDDADALYGLGSVHLQAGDAAAALPLLDRAVALMPGVPEFRFNLALAMQQSGDLATAAVLLRRAAAKVGEDRPLLARIIHAQQGLEDWAGAAENLRRYIAMQPGKTAAWRQLATVEGHLREFPAALDAFERYLALRDPPDAADRLAHADLLLMARRPGPAAAAVRQAMDLGHDGADAQFLAARCARLAGDYEEARHRLRMAVSQRPGFGNAWWLRLELEPDEAVVEEIAVTCRRLAEDPGQKPRDVILLALTAGQANERLGRYQTAFADFRLGNEAQQAILQRHGAAYDAVAVEAYVSRMCALYADAPPAGHRSGSAPIFVVGLPRSGTTVVERLLDGLPGVEAGGENEAMEFVASRYHRQLDRGQVPAPAELHAAARAELAAEYWQRTGGPPRGLVDKLPHNFRNVGLIARIFPEAPIVYLHRDPRDVAVSIYGRPFPDGHAYACDLTALGHFLGQAERLHAHWRAVMPERLLDVSYEALVREGESISREIAEFCGVPWDPACLAFHERRGASFTFSEMQVREALNERGVGRWRHYEAQLAPFVEAWREVAGEVGAGPAPTHDRPDDGGGRFWFPCALDADAGTVAFCSVDRQQMVEAAFHDERWDRSALDSRVSRLADLSQRSPPATPRFIWHTAFCCSTLLSRCLDEPGVSLSVREPSVMMEIANIARTQGAAAADSLLQSLLPALARPPGGDNCVVIKPTNAANNLISTVASLYPDARHLFLTSDVRSFVVSIAKKGETGRAFARRLFTIFAMDGHAVGRMEWRRLMQMSDLQIAALVWHMQIAEMLDVMRHADRPERFASLDADVFLSDPKEALLEVDRFFELGLSEAHVAGTTAGDLFQRDAKDVGRAFDRARRVDEASRVAASLGSELDDIIEWSYGLFPDAPRNGRLPRELKR